MLPQLQAQYNLSDPSAPTYTAGKRAASVAIAGGAVSEIIEFFL